MICCHSAGHSSHPFLSSIWFLVGAAVNKLEIQFICLLIKLFLSTHFSLLMCFNILYVYLIPTPFRLVK